MRLPPVRPHEAVSMIEEAGLAAVLDRFDIAIDGLLDLVVRVSHLAVDVGQLDALNLDPVMVSAARCAVADASGKMTELQPDGPLRRLR
jgi:ATP-grasp domain